MDVLSVVSTGIYTKLALTVNFKWNACKKWTSSLKISCTFERSVVTLKLRKEYLNTVTYNIPVLLRIKYWTVRCIERYSMSTYTGVSNFQKTVRFFWPTLYIEKWQYDWNFVVIFISKLQNLLIAPRTLVVSQEELSIIFTKMWHYLMTNGCTLNMTTNCL